ncbi:hypothetical protein E2C01_027993 [Portunus trituberculatus]|uniref:Uncharacterized protein n=1 Tax=Portunus trituberculatus TaxID=210409 RepID=A0A5B7EMQ0_PORTR|nr:hypothetical protein [Portunus trituberculatus]
MGGRDPSRNDARLKVLPRPSARSILLPAGLLPLLRCRSEGRGSPPLSPPTETLPTSPAAAPLRLWGKGLRAHESTKDLRSWPDQYFTPSVGHVGACCVLAHFSKAWRGARSTMLAWPRPGWCSKATSTT